MNNTLIMNKTSLKMQTISAAAAVVAAVALPQLFHMLGAVSGLGTALGETFLPMHLPVLLAGLLAGPLAGMLAGALSPLVSFTLSGMPGIAMLPLIMIELAGYGLIAGMLCNVKLPMFGKLLLTQIAGRAIRAAAILIAVYGMGIQSVSAAVIWNSVITGLPGILLQWSLIPLMLFWIENRKYSHE